MTIKEIKVEAFQSAVNRNLVHGGYRVVILHRECADSQYGPIPHPAVFRTEERANEFMAKILASGKHFTMRNWGHSIPAYGVL